MTNWLTSSHHRLWLDHHARELLAFHRRTGRAAGGAYWLDDDGTPDTSRPIYTWITARMAHVYGLGTLIGVPGCAPVAERALLGLRGGLRDLVHGGWRPSMSADGAVPDPAAEDSKSCYDHAFVLLAAATTAQAGLPGAQELLAEASQVFLARFWDEDAGMCVDTWDGTFETLDDYRGMNANMHAVEAMLSVAGLTGDRAWVGRAARVAGFVIRAAGENGWRIPEHFDSRWHPLPDYNRDRPADPFKPYGATVGHALEWARLLLSLEAAGDDAVAGTGSLRDAAVALFDRAVADGWSCDGQPGFVYTTGWDGVPVVRDRLWWVLAEAINTAAALHLRTGDATYARWYARWWDHADAHHIDHERGSWIGQLDSDNRPDPNLWPGKSDVYHVFQATLVPRLPLYPMLATAIDQGRLR